MGPTTQQVQDALSGLGNYRVLRAQDVAGIGTPDGISGSLLLALGMRETWLRNVEGGATMLDGRWVPETDPHRKDVGWTQISRLWHSDALRLMPGVVAGSWGPVVARKTAADGGYVPRFEEALQFTLHELHESVAYALDFVPDGDVIRVAVAGHNAGIVGAVDGYRRGNPDLHTTGGDYSAWVLAARAKVNQWLAAHPHWRR